MAGGCGCCMVRFSRDLGDVGWAWFDVFWTKTRHHLNNSQISDKNLM